MRVGPVSSVLHVCQRITAAVIGGYALAVTIPACLTLVLPVNRIDAVLTGLLVSFLVYAATVLWAFAVRSLSQMWLGIGSTTAVPGLFWILLSRGPTP